MDTHIRIYALKLADLICKLDGVHTWQTGKPRELIKIDKIWTQKHRVDQLTVREKTEFCKCNKCKHTGFDPNYGFYICVILLLFVSGCECVWVWVFEREYQST